MTVEQNIQELHRSLDVELILARLRANETRWEHCLVGLQSAAQIVRQILIVTEARNKTLPTPHEMRGIFKKKGKSK